MSDSRAAAADWLQRAARVTPGGVHSPVRAFAAMGIAPLAIVEARGAHVVDSSGRRYLDWIGAERLALMGYDAAELRAQLEAAPVSAKRLLSDLPRAAYGVLDRVLELDVLRRKWSTAGGASIGRHA